MRITIVQGAFLPVPPLKGGAVERAWQGLGESFVAKGHSVTHISRSFKGLPDRETINGVSHLRVPGFDTPSSMLKLKLMDLRYSLRVKRVLPDADILVTNTFWLPILVRGQRTGKLCVHVARLPKGQMRFYRHAARLQAVSTTAQKAIASECPECEPMIRVLPNPLDQKWFQPTKVARVPQQISYIGRVHPEKGIELLIQAVSEVKDRASLQIVGPYDSAAGGGGSDYKAKLDQIALNAGVPIEWVGPVYDVEQLVAKYDETDIFVYPSVAETGETFGLAPLEAMARGCRTIISSLECFLDFAEPGKNCLQFDHRTDGVSNLAQCLRSALDMNDEDMRERARATAQKFDLDKVSDMYLADFEEIMRS